MDDAPVVIYSIQTPRFSTSCAFTLQQHQLSHSLFQRHMAHRWRVTPGNSLQLNPKSRRAIRSVMMECALFACGIVAWNTQGHTFSHTAVYSWLSSPLDFWQHQTLYRIGGTLMRCSITVVRAYSVWSVDKVGQRGLTLSLTVNTEATSDSYMSL